MGAEAKAYLQQHAIPQLFEGLMTGLIFNKPENPLEFLEQAISQLRTNPDKELAWDMFIAKEEEREVKRPPRTDENKENKTTSKKKKVKPKERKSTPVPESPARSPPVREPSARSPSPMGINRVPSVVRAADVARIPDVPIVLFMGGPGGGKTRHAARVYNALADVGLVHICMPDIIRTALSKYKDRYSEWKEANDKYLRGELIPNHLALALVKAEMGRHPGASAYFLEGFPREARQVEDFERQVKTVNMAIILDYDERTLRDHMERRGLGMEIIDQRIKEFKQKTLPSAKYFDDQKLLHLIPGEKDDQTIFERMKKLVQQAMDTGIPVFNAHPPAEAVARGDPLSPPPLAQSPEEVATPTKETVRPPSTSNSKPPTAPSSKPSSKPSTAAGSSAKEEVKPGTANTRPPSVPREESQTRGESRQSRAVEGSAGSRRSGSVKSKPGSSSSRKAEIATSKPSTPKRLDTSSSKKSEDRPPSIVAAPTPTVEPPTAIETIATVHAASPPTAEKPVTRGLATADLPRGLPNNAPVILIIGAPGSNKYLIAQRIAKKYDGFVLLSMGDLLRRKVQESRGDELWERIGKKMEQGEALPMKICRELLYSSIHEIGSTSWGYVIEGFPRSQAQAQDFEQQVERVDLALLIDCTEQFCAENVKKRYETGLLNKTERPDDTPEIFSARLELFKANGLPMLKYLDDKAKLRVVRGWDRLQVDGDADEDRIFQEVTSIIDNTLFIEDNGSGKSLESSKNGSLHEN